MVVTAKTQCKNNEDFFFSGKEMSPLGIGYCAESESVGEQMNGRDGKVWVVSVKNGEKAWVRSPEKIGLEKEVPLASKKTVEEKVAVIINKPVKKLVNKPETKPKTKRGPTKYNLFIGSTLTRLRQEEKGLDTTVYMQRAIVIWNNLTQEEKANL